jgi:3-oxoacyl-[acyl-carrier-protein] synthase II
MGYALRQIQYGSADVIITGGADACVNDGILGAFCQMGAVSTRTDDYKKASRPFNKDRDGFVVAEGSWIFVLEELESALKRNAKMAHRGNEWVKKEYE